MRALRRRGWPALVTVVVVIGLVRAVDLHALAAALAHADWQPLAIAVLVVTTVCMLAGSARLATLLRRLPHARPIGLGELTAIQFASAAAHNVLPSPGGDVVRTVQLSTYGYSVGWLMAAQLVDKTLEAISLGLAAVVMAALGQLPVAVTASLYLVALAGVGGIAAIVIAARSHRPPGEGGEDSGGDAATTWRARLAQHWQRFCAGAHYLRTPAPWLRGIGWALLGDAAGAATVGLCAHAIGIALPLSAWYVAMLAARLVGVVPSTPGQVGVQEAAVAMALGLFGVDRTYALAAALLYRAVHFVPVTLLGGLALSRRHAPAG
jgi:uncharacterized membrane protein YbhN (UPF0104 family)